METLRIQFYNDEKVYEYPAQLVIDNIPYVANLSKEARKEIICFPSLAKYITKIQKLPEEEQGKYINKLYIDKPMFDAVLTENYESFILPVDTETDPTTTYRKNAAKLMLAIWGQIMLGINDERKILTICLVLSSQMLEGRDWNKAFTQKDCDEKLKEYQQYMGLPLT